MQTTMIRSCRVAVASDDPAALECLQNCLARGGSSILVRARTGEELIQQCSVAALDLIFADLSAPGGDGIAAVQRIAEQQDVPVVILSDHLDDQIIERVNAFRVFAYLIKPLREQDVAATIAVAIRRFQEFRTLRDEASSMRQALEERKLIERAKGILMQKHRLDESTAFYQLQKLARNHRLKMGDVAKSIILAEQAFNPYVSS